MVARRLLLRTRRVGRSRNLVRSDVTRGERARNRSVARGLVLRRKPIRTESYWRVDVQKRDVKAPEGLVGLPVFSTLYSLFPILNREPPMQCAYLYAPRDLRFVEREPLPLGPDDVRIAVAASGYLRDRSSRLFRLRPRRAAKRAGRLRSRVLRTHCRAWQRGQRH